MRKLMKKLCCLCHYLRNRLKWFSYLRHPLKISKVNCGHITEYELTLFMISTNIIINTLYDNLYNELENKLNTNK